MLATITAPHFCCGIVLTGDVVTEAAPIVKYMRGWTRDRVRDYVRSKGWSVRVVKEFKQDRRAPLAVGPTYISVDHGLRGYYAVLITDGTPSESGAGSFATHEEAAEEAAEWAMVEGLRAITE